MQTKKERDKIALKRFIKCDYCKQPIANNGWTLAKITDVTKTNYSSLEVDIKYCLRVVYINKNGETPGDPEFLVVN